MPRGMRLESDNDQVSLGRCDGASPRYTARVFFYDLESWRSILYQHYSWTFKWVALIGARDGPKPAAVLKAQRGAKKGTQKGRTRHFTSPEELAADAARLEEERNHPDRVRSLLGGLVKLYPWVVLVNRLATPEMVLEMPAHHLRRRVDPEANLTLKWRYVHLVDLYFI